MDPWRLPDVERLAIDLLSSLLAAQSITATVGIGVPVDWTPGSTPHVQVNLDGTPHSDWPIAAYSSVRFVARAGVAEATKLLASQCWGLLRSTSTDDFPRIQSLIDPMPSRDPDTNHDTAWFTLRMTARLVPLATP